jgi:hypothetical protein
MKISPKASPSSRPEPWLEELTALDMLILELSAWLPPPSLVCAVTLSEPISELPECIDPPTDPASKKLLFISVDNFDPTKKPFSIPLRRGLPKKLRVLGASPLSCKIHRMVLLEHTNTTLTI